MERIRNYWGIEVEGAQNDTRHAGKLIRFDRSSCKVGRSNLCCRLCQMGVRILVFVVASVAGTLGLQDEDVRFLKDNRPLQPNQYLVKYKAIFGSYKICFKSPFIWFKQDYQIVDVINTSHKFGFSLLSEDQVELKLTISINYENKKNKQLAYNYVHNFMFMNNGQSANQFLESRIKQLAKRMMSSKKSNQVLMNKQQLNQELYEQIQKDFQQIGKFDSILGFYCHGLDIDNVDVSQVLQQKLELLKKIKQVDQQLFKDMKQVYDLDGNQNPNLDDRSYRDLQCQYEAINQKMQQNMQCMDYNQLDAQLKCINEVLKHRNSLV